MCLAACPGEQCEEKFDLVDMERWNLLAAEVDPFLPPTNAQLCTPDDVRVEAFGSGGPLALDVDTRLGCGWATVEQTLLGELAPGDSVGIRVFYFSQTTFPAAQAELAIAFDGNVFWSDVVPIPVSSALTPLSGPVPVETAIAAGTPVQFHVGNHGDNTWNLLELSRVRLGPCP